MRIHLKINEAMRAYNRNNPSEKMNQAKLADLLFAGEQVAEQSRLVYLSQWQNGKRMERCRLEYAIRISNILNVSLSELLEINT